FVPEIADDAGRDLQLLDDLAQLATLVEEIEDAGGDAALRHGPASVGDGPLGLEGSNLRRVEQPAARIADRVQLTALHLPDRKNAPVAQLRRDLGAGEPAGVGRGCFFGLLGS